MANPLRKISDDVGDGLEARVRVQTRCFNHSDRSADHNCVYCAKCICADCARGMESGAVVCSLACMDRVEELARERMEADQFDPWPTRILSSLFLILFLSTLGALAGGWLGVRSGYTRHRTYHDAKMRELSPEAFNTRVKWFAVEGGGAGAACAIWYLVRYYRRRLD